MATPAALDKKSKQSSEYINNPFFIAAEGMKLFFNKALGITVLLIILSVLGYGHFGGFNANPMMSSVAPSTVHPEGSQLLPNLGPSIILLVVVIAVVLLATLLFIGTLVSGVVAYGAARVSQGEEATLKDGLKATFDQFWSFLWLQVLTGLKIIAWSLLFIVPGVVMAFRYSLANIAFFDKKLKGNSAIKHSLALTKGSWITTFASQTFFNLITFGALTSFVETSSKAVLYRQFSMTPLSERPKTHGLSIATLVISILFAIVILLLIASLFYALINYAGVVVGTPTI